MTFDIDIIIMINPSFVSGESSLFNATRDELTVIAVSDQLLAPEADSENRNFINELSTPTAAPEVQKQTLSEKFNFDTILDEAVKYVNEFFDNCLY
jgi:hypothetical protein